MKINKNEQHVCNLYSKKEYVLYKRTLKQVLYH